MDEVFTASDMVGDVEMVDPCLACGLAPRERNGLCLDCHFRGLPVTLFPTPDISLEPDTLPFD